MPVQGALFEVCGLCRPIQVIVPVQGAPIYRARAEGGAGGALAPPLFYNKKKNNKKNLSK